MQDEYNTKQIIIGEYYIKNPGRLVSKRPFGLLSLSLDNIIIVFVNWLLVI